MSANLRDLQNIEDMRLKQQELIMREKNLLYLINKMNRYITTTIARTIELEHTSPEDIGSRSYVRYWEQALEHNPFDEQVNDLGA